MKTNLLVLLLLFSRKNNKIKWWKQLFKFNELIVYVRCPLAVIEMFEVAAT